MRYIHWKRVMSMLLTVSMLLTSVGVATAEPQAKGTGVQKPYRTELIVRTVNQFKNSEDVQQFMRLAVENGIDVINMNVKQDEDDEVPSGHVFYKSKIAPIAAGYEQFDALAEVIAAAHSQGIQVRAWIPQFHDQAAIHNNPSWQMQALVDGAVVPFKGSNQNEYFVNPLHPEVQAYQRSIINEVAANYQVDGIVLDWLRFDDYNMDMSDYTVSVYESVYGYSPRSIDMTAVSEQRTQWNEWRTDQIGSYVKQVRQDLQQIKVDLELGVYILPPEFTEVGQDAAKFKDVVDFVAPMAYFDDWGFSSEWVYGQDGILSDTRNLVGSNVGIVPTLDNDWTVNEYQQVYGGLRKEFPQVTHLSFFSYGAWSEMAMQDISSRTTWPLSGKAALALLAEPDYAATIPTPWKARNIGQKPGTVSYSATDQTFTLGGRTTDIWGNADKLNYIYQPVQGDTTIVAQVSAMTSMDAWAKAGVMIRESLDANAKHADMLLTPTNGATFQYREQVDGVTTDKTAAATLPRWVKLSRSGNVFTGAVSANGTSWTTVGTITIPMTSEVYVGLSLSNPGSQTNSQAVMKKVTVNGSVPNPDPGTGNVPTPWISQQVGGGEGSVSHQAGEFVLSGKNTDIWDTTDQFHYVYQPMNGDGMITARVKSFTQTSEWAKAGLMIRSSLEANAQHADMMMTPNSAVFQYREVAGGDTADNSSGREVPGWIKLIRTGNQFSGYYSSDQVNWVRIGGRDVAMSNNTFIGLAFSNPEATAGNKVIIDQVQVTLGKDTTAPSAPSGAQVHEVTDATVHMTWTAATDNAAVAAYEVSNGTTTLKTNTNEITYTGLHPNTSYNFTIKAVDLSGNKSAPIALSAKTEGFNLLKGHNWNQFSGAEMAGNLLVIQGLGRGIVPLGDDPSVKPVKNPPINLRGPYLEVSGDFAVSYSMLVSKYTGASVQLYGTLPIIQDEWRQEGKMVSMGIKNGQLQVEVYNGLSAIPATASYATGAVGEVKLEMKKRGNKLEFHVNGTKAGEMNDPSVFSGGKVYFGADADAGRSYVIESIYAKPENTTSTVVVRDQSFTPVNRTGNTLRNAAELKYPNLKIGTAAAINALISDAKYAETLAREFNMITPENDMKFQFIHPQRDVYAFAEMDALMEYADLNGIAVHGHTMAWSEAVPRWVTEGNYSNVELTQILQEHIKTVVGRYPNIMSWDIINEPFAGVDSDPNIRNSVWYDALGESYIDTALRAAHEANPQAKLFINEYWIEENNVKSQAMYDLVVRLKARGVPIHGVGFQVHEDLKTEWDAVTAAAFKVVAEKFADIGIEVRVSELDMNIHKPVNATTLQEHGNYYRSMMDMVKSFNRNSIRFQAFSMWGFTDRYSSLQPHNEYNVFGNGLIMDENYVKKPAYEQLLQSLGK